MESFSRQQVAWLLGLSRQEARDIDALPSSSWISRRGAHDVGGLPIVVLRDDVHAAARRVLARAAAAGEARDVGLTAAVLALRGRGEPLRDVARQLGVSHTTVQRRWRDGLTEVLAELDAP